MNSYIFYIGDEVKFTDFEGNSQVGWVYDVERNYSVSHEAYHTECAVRVKDGTLHWVNENLLESNHTDEDY